MRQESHEPHEARRTVSYLDREGRPSDDPASAVAGEVVHYDAHGHPLRRTRFFLREDALPWLRVSEPAFLLWVLVVLIVVWLALGLVLRLI
jgi:hypothetical protein